MKSTSMERPKSEQIKQQLRCSPLDTNTGPMACFVALQNVLEVVGHVDSLVRPPYCHHAPTSARAPPDERPRRVGP